MLVRPKAQGNWEGDKTALETQGNYQLRCRPKMFDVRLDILRHGLRVDIVNRAEASKPEDKRRILGSIAFPRADTAALSQLQNAQRFAEVNGGLKSHFALASWYGHLAQGRDLSEAALALRADGLRRMAPGHRPLVESATEVELSFAGLPSFSDQHLHGLVSHLPCNLESLQLDATGPVHVVMAFASASGSPKLLPR